MPAYSVVVNFIFPGSCNHFCERTPGDVTKLASIHIQHTSNATANLAKCGDSVRIFQKLFNGSTWNEDGRAIRYPVSTVTIPFAPGASLDSWRVVRIRQCRVHIAGATSAATADFEVAKSNTISV